MLLSVSRLSRPFSSSLVSRMKIVAVPVRQDNYSYLLIDEATNQAAAVDPYDVLSPGITTHHHDDHSGGNKASTYPDAVIYAGSDKAPAATHLVKDKDELTLGTNIRIKCLATPCHTQDSICFHATDASSDHPGGVFTGDTLFIAGCGRFFEGTGGEMHAALSYLGTLPDKTIVYNGHEYTAGNLAFAKTIEPENPDIARLGELVAANKSTTGLTTIGDEKKWNVFMRLEDATVRRAAQASADTPNSAVMDALRQLKNRG
ncbi:hydroxyacylglutathione hydrolase [Mycena rosella]|uniref:hydroxyacylglutathione hydrolase n=1 Tax=Mycena rosella TaxID=1033263 RepID=A0AAD7DXX1_MYCRO|nr:hydroxyacylglutathione hydrolase [Mycena rosella]